MIPILANLLQSKGADLVNSLGAIVQNYLPGKEQRDELTRKITEEANRHTEAMLPLLEKTFENEIQDRANARAMQMAALAQDDHFSKRFVYYLASAFFALVIGFDFYIVHTTIKPENHDLVILIATALNTGGLLTIIQFFYGSSRSSQAKDETIKQLSQ